MNKTRLTTKNTVWSFASKLRSDTVARKNALFLVLERAPVSSFWCLLYTSLTGSSVYGNKLSFLERNCTLMATPLSAALHVGLFKKCGFSLYECLTHQGYSQETCMELLQSLDNNAGWTMIAATWTTTILYLISKISDLKSLLKTRSALSQ